MIIPIRLIQLFLWNWGDISPEIRQELENVLKFTLIGFKCMNFIHQFQFCACVYRMEAEKYSWSTQWREVVL